MTPPLQTRRLDLEPVRPGHADEVWPQIDDDRMWTFFPAMRPASRGDLRALYAKWERGSADPSQTWLNWICRDRAAKKTIGAMQATVFSKEHAAYLAYAVYPAHQRKGYAREASQAVIAHVRHAYGIERIFAEIDARNEASYRLAESLGFVRIEKRKSVQLLHGTDADEYLYELVPGRSGRAVL